MKNDEDSLNLKACPVSDGTPAPASNTINRKVRTQFLLQCKAQKIYHLQPEMLRNNKSSLDKCKKRLL